MNIETINPLCEELNNHDIFKNIRTIEDLRCFMEHHVYSVWDFMSLIKSAQSSLTAGTPWTPLGSGSSRRFINELVLEEESDETNIPGEYSSHFELYIRAMDEIGANTTDIKKFISVVEHFGVRIALDTVPIPEASEQFTKNTFKYINKNNPHEVAACIALGRENIVPVMFRKILNESNIKSEDAPIFHFYLNRHIQIDEESHGPMSLLLLKELCITDKHEEESLRAAKDAIGHRIDFLDSVLLKIKENKATT